jgi:hypothetical protein
MLNYSLCAVIHMFTVIKCFLTNEWEKECGMSPNEHGQPAPRRPNVA